MTDNATLDTGCYIDGHWGRYSIEHLYDLVDGLIPDDKKPSDWSSIGQIIHHSLYGDHDKTVTTDAGEQLTIVDTYDIVSDLYDELTDLLPTKPDHAWFWNDGELFYWAEDSLDDWGES